MQNCALRLMAISLLACAVGLARAPEEAEFQAANDLGADIASWIVDREPRPTSLGVFSVHANYPFEQDFGTIVENEIVKNLGKKDLNKITTCAECRQSQVSVHDDRIVITRGAPDIETIRKIGSKLPVETLLVVELYRTKIHVIAQAVLYENHTGTLLGAERFKISALNFNDASVQVLLTAGLGRAVSDIAVPGASSLSTSFNLSLLEELGFAKGGLNLGGIIGGNSSLFFLAPTLSFRGRFGGSGLGYSVNLGAGYGFTPETKGIVLKGSYELFLGSLTNIGIEGAYLIPDNSAARTLKAFFGAHIGISLGR